MRRRVGKHNKRDPKDESRRLHRARRLEELSLRDSILRVAAVGLQQADHELACAQLALDHRQDPGKRIALARRLSGQVRRLLEHYFDDPAYDPEDL